MRISDKRRMSPKVGEGPGSHEYRMNVERAGDAQFRGEKTSDFLQGLPEVVLHVEVG